MEITIYIMSIIIVPSQPTDFKSEAKSETSILLSWNPPTQTGQDNQIVGYELLYKKGDDKEEVRTWTVVGKRLHLFQNWFHCSGWLYKLFVFSCSFLRNEWALSPPQPIYWKTWSRSLLTRVSWPLAANTASAHTRMRSQPKHLRHVGPFLSLLPFLNTAVQEQAQHIIQQKSSIS